MNGMFFRGEVYYVCPTGNEIGSEQHSGRPAVIVSNNQNNKNSSTLEIVYLTTREKRPIQTHVHINASGKLQESTALCEQIFTVDKLRLNDYIGQLCDKEMQDIEFGLMVSLGLDNYLSKPKEALGTADIVGPVVIPDPAPAPVKSVVQAFSDGRKNLVQPAAPSEGEAFLRAEFISACAQRDVYRELCMKMIEQRRA